MYEDKYGGCEKVMLTLKNNQEHEKSYIYVTSEGRNMISKG